MDRRQFLAATGAFAAVEGQDGLWRANAVSAATGDEIKGELRRLTPPGGGDNRATYLPDGRTLLLLRSVRANPESGRATPTAAMRGGFMRARPTTTAASRPAPTATSSPSVPIATARTQSMCSRWRAVRSRASRIQATGASGPSWSSRDLIAYFSRRAGMPSIPGRSDRTGRRRDKSLINRARAANPGGRRMGERSLSPPITGRAAMGYGSRHPTEPARERSHRAGLISNLSGARTDGGSPSRPSSASRTTASMS